MQFTPTEACGGGVGSFETGNVAPLMHQVRHALQAMLDEGTETVIDLRAIPLAPGEEERLNELLGCGEVRIAINALGPSEIIETSYPGVWLSTHRNHAGEVIGRYIEVCPFPALAGAQLSDIRAGLQALSARLES